jgi:hypothetical protein
VRQTRDGQLWRGRLALVSKDERSKGEKGGSEMAAGPWLSSSGRAKAKDPGGRRLCFKKKSEVGNNYHFKHKWLKSINFILV